LLSAVRNVVLLSCVLCGPLPRLIALEGMPDAAQRSAERSGIAELKTLSLEQLGDVEVTTESKEPTQVWDTPSAIYVLTQDDIRRSGVTNIPDALRLVPGVNVERVSGSRNWAVGIRGFGDQFSKYVQVLIDGRSIYSPLFGGVLWTINNVMLEDIDRIEVIRGPGGTIWGSNAVNGIINIITKSAGDTHGEVVSVGGGDVDQGTESSRYGSRKHNVDYRAYTLGFVRNSEYHLPGQPNYDWSRLGQVGIHADWKHGPNEFTVQGDAYIGRFGDAQSLSTYMPPTTYISYAPGDGSGGNMLGRWRRDLGQESNLYLQVYWSHDYRIGSNFGETRNDYDIDFLHRTPRTEHQQFTYGLGMHFSPSRIKQVVPTDTFLPLQKTDYIYSAFVQESLRIIPNRLSFTVGSKLEYNNYTRFEYQPSGRLLWTPSSKASLWASVSRAVRRPDRVDDDIKVDGLASTSPLTIYAEILGNTNLRTEQLVAYEGGYRALLHPRFFLDFAGFHNRYRDLIAQGAAKVTIPPSPPYPPSTYLVSFQFLNGINGNTDGAEIAPDWKPTDWWQIKAAYSYLHVHVKDNPGFTDTATLTTLHGSSPNSQAVLRSLISLPHSFEFDQTIRYMGSLPAQQVRSYVTGDMRVGYRGIRGLDLSVAGENLFQPHHAEFGISPAPNVLIKRSVYAKLVWTR